MVSTTKRKTSLTLDAEVLDCAKELDINVSAVAEAALKDAVASARQAHWLKQNAEAFAAQAAWHERHGHPLADIISAPGGFVERLTRYDIAEYNGVKMVVVESDLLPPDPAVVVIPLLTDYPAVKELNPELVHDGERWVLATRLIAAVRRSRLRRVGNVADQGDRISRAVDVLMAGV